MLTFNPMTVINEKNVCGILAMRRSQCLVENYSSSRCGVINLQLVYVFMLFIKFYKPLNIKKERPAVPPHASGCSGLYFVLSDKVKVFL